MVKSKMFGVINLNLLKLTKKQSFFVICLILVLLPILGFIVTLYTNTIIFIAIIAVIIAFLGSLIAKKTIKK